MTSTRRMKIKDLFRYNVVNLDKLTETYDMDFYSKYFFYWPDYQYSIVHSNSGEKKVIGYILGKAEGKNEKWHGHVSAVTISPNFRRLGFGNQLMHLCHKISDKIYDTYFVDLFVRASNDIAVDCYRNLGYVIYRRIIGYYSGTRDGEDAFDMRFALPRDRDKKSIIPLTRDVYPHEIEFN